MSAHRSVAPTGRARKRAHPIRRAVAVAGCGIYCWTAAGLRPFTAPVDVAVALPAAVVGVFASWGSRGRDVPPAAEHPPTLQNGAPWVAVFGLLAGWEALAYFSSPRRNHPTLSSMANAAMGTHPGRAALFAIWLLLGWALFVRHETRG